MYSCLLSLPINSIVKRAEMNDLIKAVEPVVVWSFNGGAQNRDAFIKSETLKQNLSIC
jgi:hypothetical protein